MYNDIVSFIGKLPNTALNLPPCHFKVFHIVTIYLILINKFARAILVLLNTTAVGVY